MEQGEWANECASRVVCTARGLHLRLLRAVLLQCFCPCKATHWLLPPTLPIHPSAPDGLLGAITSGGNDSSTTPGDILNQVIGGISGALGTDLQVSWLQGSGSCAPHWGRG